MTDKKRIARKLQRIRLLLLDVDGVLTDGSIALLPTGEQVRTMNTKDGYAMQLAIKKGYQIIIISGGKSESARAGPVERASVPVHESDADTVESAGVGWQWIVGVREAVGEGAVPLAGGRGT